MDLNTGQRAVLSGPGVGTGPELEEACDLAVAGPADEALVMSCILDSEVTTTCSIIGVDLVSGTRRVVATSSGLFDVRALGVDTRSGDLRALLLSLGDDVVTDHCHQVCQDSSLVFERAVRAPGLPGRDEHGQWSLGQRASRQRCTQRSARISSSRASTPCTCR